MNGKRAKAIRKMGDFVVPRETKYKVDRTKPGRWVRTKDHIGRVFRYQNHSPTVMRMCHRKWVKDYKRHWKGNFNRYWS
jgi:hypothetical protein